MGTKRHSTSSPTTSSDPAGVSSSPQTENVPDRNDSAGQFGWDFQINAGIVIMLDYIREANAVKIEGKKEDIEVFLKDGRRVFAQAKSPTNPEDSSNAIRDLGKALVTLNEADRSSTAQQLIFVTNRADPFNDETTRRCFSNAYSKRTYSELPDVCQTKIVEICHRKEISFPTDKFTVISIVFWGDGEMRYQTIKERVAEFLVGIDPSFQGFGPRALSLWQLRFDQNASQNDRNRTIKKTDMIWPLIVWLCETREVSRISNFDSADQDEIEERFSSVINEQAERFDLVARVTNAYFLFQKEHPDINRGEIESEFIASHSVDYSSDFDLTGLDSETSKAVIQFTIAKILRGRRKIAQVKEAVAL